MEPWDGPANLNPLWGLLLLAILWAVVFVVYFSKRKENQ